MIAVLVIHRQFWIFLGLHPVAQAHSQWFYGTLECSLKAAYILVSCSVAVCMTAYHASLQEVREAARTSSAAVVASELCALCGGGEGEGVPHFYAWAQPAGSSQLDMKQVEARHQHNCLFIPHVSMVCCA